MLPLPTLHSLVAEEHGNREGGFAIRRHVEHKLRACRRLAPGRPLAFVEILVDVSALGRVCFLPPHFRRARQRSFLFPKPVEHQDSFSLCIADAARLGSQSTSGAPSWLLTQRLQTKKASLSR